jgi:hypothetical protein
MENAARFFLSETRGILVFVMSFVALALIAVIGASGTVVEILVCFVLLKVYPYYYLFYLYLPDFRDSVTR